MGRCSRFYALLDFSQRMGFLTRKSQGGLLNKAAMNEAGTLVSEVDIGLDYAACYSTRTKVFANPAPT